MVTINTNNDINPYTKGLNISSHFMMLRSMQCLFPAKLRSLFQLKVSSKLPPMLCVHGSINPRPQYKSVEGERNNPWSRDTDFTLPPMQCSFPVKLHPQYEAVKEECEPWILNLVHSKHRQFLVDCLLPRYVCRLCPYTTDLPRLVTATKFISWLTLADDFVDIAQPVKDKDSMGDCGSTQSVTDWWANSVLLTLQKTTDRSTAVVMPPAPASLGDPQMQRGLVMLHALEELWEEMSPKLLPRARARFISEMQQHLEALSLQPTNNPAFGHLDQAAGAGSANPSVVEYMAIRRPCSGFIFGFELLLYVLDLDRDPIHLHPLVHELRDLVVDYMCICNDMVSCRTETSAGNFFNLPCIVYTSGVADTFQEALDIVAEMLEQVDARCVQVVDAIRRNEELMTMEPKLEMYLLTMMACMSGTLRWSFETTRYGLKQEDGTPSC